MWTLFHLSVTFFIAPFVVSWSAIAVWLGLTYVTLLLGHSVGMHRNLIHRSFECPRWLRNTLLYIGTVVGMAGPFGILKIHDIRDWAQRQPKCHEFFAHTQGLWRDAIWNLAYVFEFSKPPTFSVEDELKHDRFLVFLERTWPLQQFPIAALLYVAGGWSWVVWGICVRIATSIAAHWIVTYYAHNPRSGRWWVLGAGVQASDLPGWGFLTHGEAWHNNHHAFPESYRMGVDGGQSDTGARVIEWFARVGLAWNLGRPRPHQLRDDLQAHDFAFARSRSTQSD
jgi:fatty-acid desaturase